MNTTPRIFTEEELDTYSGLLYQARIPSSALARAELSKFEETQGKAKIDAMFAELTRRDSIN